MRTNLTVANSTEAATNVTTRFTPVHFRCAGPQRRGTVAVCARWLCVCDCCAAAAPAAPRAKMPLAFEADYKAGSADFDALLVFACRGGYIIPMQPGNGTSGTPPSTTAVKASPLSFVLPLPGLLAPGNASSAGGDWQYNLTSGLMYNDDGEMLQVGGKGLQQGATLPSAACLILLPLQPVVAAALPRPSSAMSRAAHELATTLLCCQLLGGALHSHLPLHPPFPPHPLALATQVGADPCSLLTANSTIAFNTSSGRHTGTLLLSVGGGQAALASPPISASEGPPAAPGRPLKALHPAPLLRRPPLAGPRSVMSAFLASACR